MIRRGAPVLCRTCTVIAASMPYTGLRGAASPSGVIRRPAAVHLGARAALAPAMAGLGSAASMVQHRRILDDIAGVVEATVSVGCAAVDVGSAVVGTVVELVTAAPTAADCADAAAGVAEVSEAVAETSVPEAVTEPLASHGADASKGHPSHEPVASSGGRGPIAAAGDVVADVFPLDPTSSSQSEEEKQFAAELESRRSPGLEAAAASAAAAAGLGVAGVTALDARRGVEAASPGPKTPPAA